MSVPLVVNALPGGSAGPYRSFRLANAREATSLDLAGATVRRERLVSP
jgi:hypothetical protein